MAKKKSKKQSDKKGNAEEAKRLKAEKKARKAKKAAEKEAAKKAKAAKSAKPAKPSESAKPDQIELLKLALRSTEAKLVDAEHRLRQVQQQLDDERRALAEAASGEQLVEDALLDAAVEATVTEIVIETGAVVAASDAVLSDAEIAEAVAEQLDEVAGEAEPAVEEPAGGDAEAAAKVFEDAGVADVPPATDEELTPPTPSVPDPGEPNASWTLLRLREEAKRRGLQGTSSLPKAELLGRLQQG